MPQASRPDRAGGSSVSLREGIASMSGKLPAQVFTREESTPRFTLRALTASDRDEFVALVEGSLAHLSPWIPLLARGASPEEFFDTELERTLKEEPARHSFRRIGIADERMVGMFNLFNCSSGLTLTADASWWVARPYVRRGYATAGVRFLLRHAFADLPEGLGLHKVMAMIAPENLASLKLARALGFRPFMQEDHYVRVGDTWKRHECWVADSLAPALTEVKPPRGISRPSLRSERE